MITLLSERAVTVHLWHDGSIFGAAALWDALWYVDLLWPDAEPRRRSHTA